jgi:hypothetical protein
MGTSMPLQSVVRRTAVTVLADLERYYFAARDEAA